MSLFALSTRGELSRVGDDFFSGRTIGVIVNGRLAPDGERKSRRPPGEIEPELTSRDTSRPRSDVLFSLYPTFNYYVTVCAGRTINEYNEPHVWFSPQTVPVTGTPRRGHTIGSDE